MKTKLNTSSLPGADSIEPQESNPLLLHFLSPLELAAYRHQFKKFIYQLDGLPLEIDARMCRQLFFQARHHANECRDLLLASRMKLLKQSDEKIRQFLTRPLKHQGLPAPLCHLLTENSCYTMADVAAKGVRGLSGMHGMGKARVTQVMNLFMENNCGSLFL